MKIAFIIATLLLGCAYAQQTQHRKHDIPVKVNDWGSKLYMITDEFWNSTQQEITGKIGKERFELIKQFCSHKDNKNAPTAFLIYDPVADRKVPTEEYQKRMSTLTLYKAVDFSRVYDGTVFKYTALSVPFQKLYWDTTAKWDTTYFVIRSTALE